MNLLALKNRIKSVKNIGQVTKAMELVAATKMRKAQQRAVDSRAYSAEIESLIHKLLSGNSLENFALAKENDKASKNLLVLIGPSKGLAGALISNLSRETYNYLIQNPDTDLITIDKKGAYIGEKSGKKIIADMENVRTNIEEYELDPIIELIKQEYKSGNYKKVSVVFTHFINTLVQKPMVIDLLPIKLENKESQPQPDFLIEPTQNEVIQQLLEKYVNNKLFIAVLDSISSEYSARMIAMKNAGDNAKELKDDLTLEYNQSRQAAITQQILEIAGATAAMESTD